MDKVVLLVWSYFLLSGSGSPLTLTRVYASKSTLRPGARGPGWAPEGAGYGKGPHKFQSDHDELLHYEVRKHHLRKLH